MKFYTLLSLFFIVEINSCGLICDTCTPKQFLNHSKVSPAKYSSDSLVISKKLESFKKEHKEFFFSSEYFELTRIIIDTILYSETLNKIVVIVIAKNPTYRQEYPAEGQDWYHNGTAYLGLTNNQTVRLSLRGPIFTNSPEQKTISDIMRAEYFCGTFIKSSGIEYNLNDVRFWKSSVWKQKFD